MLESFLPLPRQKDVSWSEWLVLWFCSQVHSLYTKSYSKGLNLLVLPFGPLACCRPPLGALKAVVGRWGRKGPVLTFATSRCRQCQRSARGFALKMTSPPPLPTSLFASFSWFLFLRRNLLMTLDMQWKKEGKVIRRQENAPRKAASERTV